MDGWLKEVANEQLQPYKEEVSKQPLLSAQPVPGQIRSEQQDTGLHVTTLMLSNGVRVVLKPTDFKNDEIVFNGFASGGTSLYNDADYESAANAAELVAANGAGNYDPGQLDSYLEGKQLSVHPYINDRFEGIRGRSTRTDLETALQLLYADDRAPEGYCDLSWDHRAGKIQSSEQGQRSKPGVQGYRQCHPGRPQCPEDGAFDRKNGQSEYR